MFRRIVSKLIGGSNDGHHTGAVHPDLPKSTTAETGASDNSPPQANKVVDVSLKSKENRGTTKNGKPGYAQSDSRSGRRTTTNNFNSTSEAKETMEQEVATNEADHAEQTETAAGTGCEHFYYEVGNDLLAKPNALSDIIEAFGSSPTVVFCNSPSEADMVEVMLGKRNVSSEKLIGHVPFQKVAVAVQNVLSGKSVALIITDVAAKDLEVEAFSLVVNYSIHEDPEIYIHRSTGSDTSSTLKGIASLVSPLDFSNFHYLRKISGIEIAKKELPSSETLASARMGSFLEDAVSKGKEVKEKVALFLDAINQHEDKDTILAYLIHNTTTVLPELKSASERQGRSSRRNENRDRDDRGDSRDGRERGRRGRDRDGDRDSRGRNNREGRRDRDQRGDRDGRNDRDEQGGRDRNDRRRRDDRDSDGRRGRESSRRELAPAKKDVRIYLGHGSKQEFSEEKFVKLLSENTELPEDVVQRFSLRANYSFVDIDQEQCDAVLESIQDLKVDGDTPLTAHRATTIPVPRERVAAPEDEAAKENDHTEEGYDESPKVAFDEEE